MFHLLINPSGGAGKANKLFNEIIKPRFDLAKVEYKIYYSTLEYDLDKLVNDINQSDNEETIVIVGGDGSMNDAINGINNFEKIKLGYIPSGSGNDLALGLELPDINELLNRIIDNKVLRRIDVGEVIYNDKIEHRYFNISCGIGFDAEVTEKVNRSKLKKYLNKVGLGKLAYTLISIGLIFSTKNASMKIILDDKEYEYHNTLFVVGMNHKYDGGGFMFCPEAKDDDGVLDFCIASPKGSNMIFFKAFPTAYKGNHLKFDCIDIKKGYQAKIISDKPLWVHTDGEVKLQSTNITMVVHHQLLKMII